MNRELEQIIKYDHEGSNLDYEKEEYVLGKNEKKNEILKDISLFANHHSESNLNNSKAIYNGPWTERGEKKL